MQRKGNSGVPVTSEGHRPIEIRWGEQRAKTSPHSAMKEKIRKGTGNKLKANLVLPQNLGMSGEGVRKSGLAGHCCRHAGETSKA